MPKLMWMREEGRRSKQRAIKAMQQTRENRQPAFRKAIQPYWKQVVADAKKLCPVDTGTLQSTIRVRNRPPAGLHFEVFRSPDSVHITRTLLAGGYKVNPRTGRICDYAQAVHDGTSKMIGRPFLSMAIDMNQAKLERAISKYFDEMLKDWGGS